MNKPITIERQDYMRKLVEATNACPLPAVFKADIMDAALRKLRQVADEELNRDMKAYAARCGEKQDAPADEEPEV